MFKLFKVNKEYTDKELFSALKKDGIVITEHEIQKARENDTEVLYKIGEAYYKSDSHKSFAWFYKAALQDHTEAQYRVGHMYIWGTGVSKDYKLAMDWAIKAASAGNSHAQFIVGQLYCYGWGVPEDYKQAMNWFMKAVNNGNKDAMNMVGIMHNNGLGVPENVPIAIEWYRKAANQGRDKLQDHYPNEQKGQENSDIVNMSTGITNTTENMIEKRKELKNNSRDNIASRIYMIENQHKMHIEALEIEIEKERIRSNEEKRHLKDEVTKLKELLQDNAINDIYYDSDDNERASNDNNEHKDDNHQGVADSVDLNYDNGADPNYNSSDNEDYSKDLYLD